ncbi:hypothetical protein O181_020629 [Austropuccinia psidii MF-1]|uniref:Uncharacterized protein n=1 Tax=Austropuccinia psidii MF-1 TaxID=1389203 RepID=A0A9Q3C9A4_9BASI|nr:hypothetical protein [Austropuccinia psidii MF-1]
MSPVHLRDLGFQRNHAEDREGLSRTRRPGRGHLGHSVGWQDTEGNHTHSAIHFPFQQESQNRGLERYGSSPLFCLILGITSVVLGLAQFGYYYWIDLT